MRTVLLLPVLLVSGLFACADSSELGPLADRCGEVTAFYLGVEQPLAVAGGEVDSEAGRVRIDYRTERAGTPVEGVALCHFRAEADGSLVLSGAFVDEKRLRPDEIDAFNLAAAQ